MQEGRYVWGDSPEGYKPPSPEQAREVKEAPKELTTGQKEVKQLQKQFGQVDDMSALFEAEKPGRGTLKERMANLEVSIRQKTDQIANMHLDGVFKNEDALRSKIYDLESHILMTEGADKDDSNLPKLRKELAKYKNYIKIKAELKTHKEKWTRIGNLDATILQFKEFMKKDTITKPMLRKLAYALIHTYGPKLLKQKLTQLDPQVFINKALMFKGGDLKEKKTFSHVEDSFFSILNTLIAKTEQRNQGREEKSKEEKEATQMGLTYLPSDFDQFITYMKYTTNRYDIRNDPRYEKVISTNDMISDSDEPYNLLLSNPNSQTMYLYLRSFPLYSTAKHYTEINRPLMDMIHTLMSKQGSPDQLYSIFMLGKEKKLPKHMKGVFFQAFNAHLKDTFPQFELVLTKKNGEVHAEFKYGKIAQQLHKEAVIAPGGQKITLEQRILNSQESPNLVTFVQLFEACGMDNIEDLIARIEKEKPSKKLKALALKIIGAERLPAQWRGKAKMFREALLYYAVTNGSEKLKEFCKK